MCGARLGEVIDCTWYSDFNKLLRVTGYVLKFKSLVQRTQASQKGECRLVHKDQLTEDDIMLLRYCGYALYNLTYFQYS